MLLCTFFYIGRIDNAPRKDCCGCTMHTRARYAASVDVNAPAYALPVHYGGSGYGSYGGAYQPPGTQAMGGSGRYSGSSGGYGATAQVVIGGKGAKAK